MLHFVLAEYSNMRQRMYCSIAEFSHAMSTVSFLTIVVTNVQRWDERKMQISIIPKTNDGFPLCPGKKKKSTINSISRRLAQNVPNPFIQRKSDQTRSSFPTIESYTIPLEDTDGQRSKSLRTSYGITLYMQAKLTIIARRKFKSLKLFVWIVSFSVRHSSWWKKKDNPFSELYAAARTRVDNRVKKRGYARAFLRESHAPNQTAQEGPCTLRCEGEGCTKEQ